MLLASTAPAAADWAVALGQSGNPIVVRYRGEDEARRDALSTCKTLAQGCKVAASGGDGCVALATTGERWGVGKGGSKKRAGQIALQQCAALNVGPCKVVHDFCGQ